MLSYRALYYRPMQKHDRSNGQNRLSEWLIAANLPDGLKLPTALALATSLKLSPADVRAGLREAETEGLVVRSKPGWYYSKRLPIRTMLT